MAIPFLSNIDLNRNQALQLVLHNKTSDPSPAVEGQVYWNSSENKAYVYNGSAWINIGGDITGVDITAGAGLTGTVATTGGQHTQTINAVGGDGITVNADEIEATVDGVTIGLNNTNGSGALFVKDASITNAKLAADSVNGAKIADDSIDSEHYVDGSIDTAHIANDAVTGDKLANSITIAQDLTVTGDLTVSGDTISANVGTLDVEDKNITVNKSSGDSSSTADGAGLTIQDAVDASTDATMLWSASNDNFVFSHEIAAPSLDISGNVDVDGTMEADAITVNGTALNTVIDGRVTARESSHTVPASAKTAGTAFTVTHNLNSRDIIVQVYNLVKNIDGDGGATEEIDNLYETINVEIYRNTVNQITIKSGIALAANSLRVLITKIG